ncbi:MAG: circularly permuted type 2 ATP-grasp protein [Vicinamibacterales bacterium]
MTADPARIWQELFARNAGDCACADLAARMRAEGLTFGGRLLCPFLRPFFLPTSDEARVRTAAEGLAAIGERVARLALETPSLVAELGLSEAELRLAAIDPGYQTASTASRADAFILPDSLWFAEYNAESPAGPGYAQRLAEVFQALPVMARFREGFAVSMHKSIERLHLALLTSFREWGGTAVAPVIAIVDWRDVPTWSEFELLATAFSAQGTPTIVADPRDLEVANGRLVAAGRAIDLVYRRVLINDIVARHDECRLLVEAYARRLVCVANTFRCKVPHKKAFFAVLTDDRHAALFNSEERDLIRRHVPWTRRLAQGDTTRDGARIDLLSYVRAHREELVVKPSDEYGGSGVTLGWETNEKAWDRALERAVREPERAWIVQARIPVRRERFAVCDEDGGVVEREMLVDFAPYLFRGRLGGYLTRLSASGLANVTSGGGQVPAFVIG